MTIQALKKLTVVSRRKKRLSQQAWSDQVAENLMVEKKMVEKMVQNIQSIDLYKKRFPSINQVQFKGVSQNNAKTFATSTMSVFL